MRLAWFAPMPPDDGLASPDPSTVVLPLLQQQHQIEVFAGSAAHAAAWQDWGLPVRAAHDFVWRQLADPFHLVVYHLSNQPSHDYVWAYLWNYPGLVVLHDTRLHHARARTLLERSVPRLDDYASELLFNHGIRHEVHEALALFTGPTLGLWPMRAAVTAGARSVAVHDDGAAGELLAECPGLAVETIRLGVPDPGPHPSLRASIASENVRRGHRIPDDATVLAVFGPLTRSQRLPEILNAFTAIHQMEPKLHLMLAGASQDEYDVRSEVQAKRISDHVTITGAIRDGELPAFMGAADVGLFLSWPNDGGTSPVWLRCVASGMPTVVTELEHETHLPMIEPRSWQVRRSRSATGHAPIAVTVDLLHEPQALRSTFEQLGHDAKLREQLGQAARAWWSEHHTPQVMANDYADTIERVAARTAPARPLPTHLRPDVLEHTRALLTGIGVAVPAEMSSTADRAANPDR